MMCYIDEQERYQFVNRAYPRGLRPRRRQAGRAQDARAVLGEAEYKLHERSYIERALAGSTSVFDVGLAVGRWRAALRPRHLRAASQRRRAGSMGFFTLIQDITERRRAQHMLEMAKEDLERRGLRTHRQPAGAERDPGARDRGEAPHRARTALRPKVERSSPTPARRQFPADASHDLLQPLQHRRACSSPRSRAASCRAIPPTMSRRSTVRWSTSRISSTFCSTSQRWSPAG